MAIYRFAAMMLLSSFAALAGPKPAAAPKRTTFVLAHKPMAPPKQIKPTPPTVLVHFASGWKKGGPLNLVVHFHGIQNCVSATVEKGSASCPGAGAGTAHGLIAQLDASGANAVLIAMEVAYRQNNTDAGNLEKPGFFKSVIDDALAEINTLKGTSYSSGKINKLILTSHSGGYEALIESAVNGGLDVKSIFLMDSFYPTKDKCAKRKCTPADKKKNDDCATKYLDWITGGSGRKFVNIYSAGGGTKAGSQLLAADAQAAGVAVETFGNKQQNDKPKAAAGASFGKPVVFFFSKHIHDDIPRNYFGTVVAKLVR